MHRTRRDGKSARSGYFAFTMRRAEKFDRYKGTIFPTHSRATMLKAWWGCESADRYTSMALLVEADEQPSVTHTR